MKGQKLFEKASQKSAIDSSKERRSAASTHFKKTSALIPGVFQTVAGNIPFVSSRKYASQMKKAANMRMETGKAAENLGSAHPFSGPDVKASTSRRIDPTEKSSPNGSILRRISRNLRPCIVRARGTTRRAIPVAIAEMIDRVRKSHLQDTASKSPPEIPKGRVSPHDNANTRSRRDLPITTPREKETLPTSPKMAIARFLAFPAGNVLTVRLLSSQGNTVSATVRSQVQIFELTRKTEWSWLRPYPGWHGALKIRSGH